MHKTGGNGNRFCAFYEIFEQQILMLPANDGILNLNCIGERIPRGLVRGASILTRGNLHQYYFLPNSALTAVNTSLDVKGLLKSYRRRKALHHPNNQSP